MKKILFILITVVAFNLNAQHTISGTFSPAKDYTWLIAYQLKSGSQVYAADTAIKNGKFTLSLPDDALPGTYRLVYAVPQEEYNFDIIYNGKEDIVLNFSTENGVAFTSSKENILLNTYLSELSGIEQEIIEFYNSNNKNKDSFSKTIDNLNELQKSYEMKSKGLIAYNFIAANKPYIPQKFETVQEYILHKKENYFKAIDFKNTELENSNFLIDKVANYVFTALPLASISKEETEKEIIKNTDIVNSFISNLNPDFKFQLYHNLWDYAVAYDYNDVSDYIYTTYLKDLASETNNEEVKNTIEAHNRLRLGATAPEIVWKKGNELHKLTELTGADKYILIFWSSTCSHCLNELPPLNKELKEKAYIKVLAVGLEDDTKNWEIACSKLDGFEHAISLGKWDSEYAHLYDIHSTPTYFILDKEKHIVAKPENDKAVVEYLEKNL
tara:strand:+ start:8302 stop:9627 length:1326 start_codon:yes stop_codon:yes gene_type:complete